jgi:hypothetical protein
LGNLLGVTLPRHGQADFVGCPMAWLELVLPYTKTGKQLAVAA